jgi:hypothetical protein
MTRQPTAAYITPPGEPTDGRESRYQIPGKRFGQDISRMTCGAKVHRSFLPS